MQAAVVADGDLATARYPVVPGHEFAGEVVAVGQDVPEDAARAVLGERVTDVVQVPQGDAGAAVDFYGKLDGKPTTFAIIGNPRASVLWDQTFFDKRTGTATPYGERFLQQVGDHLLFKGDIVVMDLRGFDEDQIKAVENVLNGLDEKYQVKVMPIGFNWVSKYGFSWESK